MKEHLRRVGEVLGKYLLLPTLCVVACPWLLTPYCKCNTCSERYNQYGRNAALDEWETKVMIAGAAFVALAIFISLLTRGTRLW